MASTEQDRTGEPPEHPEDEFEFHRGQVRHTGEEDAIE